jgi:hypothetical protein
MRVTLRAASFVLEVPSPACVPAQAVQLTQ